MATGHVTVDTDDPEYFQVILHGDIDLTCREELRKLLALYAGSSQVSVIVDLSAVTSLSSTGLAALAALHEEARRRQGHLRLHHAPAGLMPVLTSSGLGVATVLDVVS
jgi:anti-anti-sigma factor